MRDCGHNGVCRGASRQRRCHGRLLLHVVREGLRNGKGGCWRGGVVEWRRAV